MKSEYRNWNIETGTLNDVDELEKLYNDLNDYLQSEINYAGWLKVLLS